MSFRTQYTLVFTILLCISVYSLNGQIIEGKVNNQKTGKGIPYVNIGIQGKGFGTVSDEFGNFSLSIPTEYVKDSLRFSCIGYEARNISINSLFDQSTIALESIPYELKSVEVKPKNYKNRILGNTTDSKILNVGFKENLLGYELGVIMKTKGKPTWIDSIQLNFSSCRYDSVFFRMNIYEFMEEVPANNLLNKPIYLSFSKEDLRNSILIDISKLGLYTERDFLVSLELVRDLGVGNLFFSTGFFLAPIYYRKTSHDSWRKFPFGAGIATFVTQEK